MTIFEKKANEVAEYMFANLNVPKVRAFDPMMILAIISLIVEFYKLMRYWCDMTEEETLEKLRSPGPIGRLMLRRVSNRVFADKGALAKQSGKVRKALLAVASATTPEDSAAMYAETPNV